jgi:hypothetical protein
LRQGGGVGDVMNLSVTGQWISDTTYFLIMIVMLLNIIFGIIIDTFSSLRANKNERLEDTEQVCFICGIGKQVFDRASDEPDGFKNHVKIDHNMWNYLYYIFMLWEQDRDDDDGLELYVRKAIEADEIIWFPVNKAIRLDQAATEEEEMIATMAAEIQQHENAVTDKLNNFQMEINVFLEQISLATKQSYASGDTKNGIAKFLREFSAKEIIADENGDSATEGVRLSSPIDLEDEQTLPADGVSGEEEEVLGGIHEEDQEDSDVDDVRGGTSTPRLDETPSPGFLSGVPSFKISEQQSNHTPSFETTAVVDFDDGFHQPSDQHKVPAAEAGRLIDVENSLSETSSPVKPAEGDHLV